MKKLLQMNLRNVIRNILLLTLLCVAVTAEAQIRPVYDQGALGLGRLLKRLNTSASVLMIGAHPDDEDTALLSYLARGENARTAYLSLTRGDGGQNILGTELGEALGVIRTEELLQARKLDGAEQYFTRAYDYGFSKTLAEAKEKWDEKIILCDVVRVIRQFRPLVVVSQFNGTPADGHGQHQYSGYISPLAVKAAADISQCTNTGPAWEVKKFYFRHRGGGEPSLRINTGKYDPMLGRSYFEIAMEARSQHRSQEQGVLELKGEAFSNLNLVGGGAGEKSVFETIDISVRGIASHTGETSERLAGYLDQLQKTASQALEKYEILSPNAIVPLLAESYQLAIDAESSAGSPGAKAFLDQKQGEALAALKLASGIQSDAISDRETVSADETVNVAVRVFFPPGSPVTVKDVKIQTVGPWKVTKTELPPAQTLQGRREVANFGVAFAMTIPVALRSDQPYWLFEGRRGDMFGGAYWQDLSFPIDPPRMSAEIKATVAGKDVTFSQPVEYRYADDVRGEIRRPLVAVPALSISLDQELLITPLGDSEVQRQVAATVTSHSSGPVEGTLRLSVPRGWSVEPREAPVSLARKGESSSVSFLVTVPANWPVGKYSVSAAAKIGGTTHFLSMRTISYPHIQTRRIYRQATGRVTVIDLKTSPAKIGYITGSGDRVPEAIRQMGLDLEVIDERTLASGDLSRFDVIVVGIRAYQVRLDVVASNKRLLDFAAAGGTLVVQYQLPGYTQQNLAPFPAQQGPRAADENAKVTILQPDHPIFNVPNKITDADFIGWVQERNLYNFSTMDEKYAGLLESHDAGEPENKGGLVVADVGKGKYIYCSYSLFRQLPAGVPGAYRLVANMLSYRGMQPRKP